MRHNITLGHFIYIYTEMEKKELTARGLGIGLLIAGVLFIGINTYLIIGQGYYMIKLTLGGFVLLGMGAGMVLFPGPVIAVEDKDQYKVDLNAPVKTTKPERLKGSFGALWKSLRILDKLMWVVFTAIGLLIAYFYFGYFGLTLFNDL